MSALATDVKSLGVRCKLLHKTLGQKLYPRLSPAAASSSASSSSEYEWPDILDDYFMAAKQLDELSHELKSVYSMHIPAPRKHRQTLITDGASTSNTTATAGEFSFTVPQILSTMVPKEDEEDMVHPDISFEPPRHLKHHETTLVADHNDAMGACLRACVPLILCFSASLLRRSSDSLLLSTMPLSFCLFIHTHRVCANTYTPFRNAYIHSPSLLSLPALFILSSTGRVLGRFNLLVDEFRQKERTRAKDQARSVAEAKKATATGTAAAAAAAAVGAATAVATSTAASEKEAVSTQNQAHGKRKRGNDVEEGGARKR